MEQLLSFKNDQAIKQFYLDRLLAHEKADEITQGITWENGKGCAVGCTLHDYNHSAYETELGLPTWLARLEDTLFEGMPNDEAKKFPRELLEAIPVGKSLDKVKWQFCAFLMNENIERTLALDLEESLKTTVVDALRQVLSLHNNAIESGEWDESAAWAAESAARAAESAASGSAASGSAAWSAARAAESAAARAAESAAAWSAARAAESAASGSAAWAAAWSAAWSAAFVCYKDKLIELLRAV